jgi:hypothetical protein
MGRTADGEDFAKLGQIRWDVVDKVLRPKMEPQSGYPTRYLVSDFPTDHEFQQMQQIQGTRNWLDDLMTSQKSQ